MSDESNELIKEYSEDGYWLKLARFARVAGVEVVEKTLWLYYSAQRAETPAWAKGIIYGALGYFILPLDAIPDLTPLVGYADDLGALVIALATVAAYIDQDVKQQAQQRMARWFGEPAADVTQSVPKCGSPGPGGIDL